MNAIGGLCFDGQQQTVQYKSALEAEACGNPENVTWEQYWEAELPNYLGDAAQYLPADVKQTLVDKLAKTFEKETNHAKPYDLVGFFARRQFGVYQEHQCEGGWFRWLPIHAGSVPELKLDQAMVHNVIQGVLTEYRPVIDSMEIIVNGRSLKPGQALLPGIPVTLKIIGKNLYPDYSVPPLQYRTRVVFYALSHAGIANRTQVEVGTDGIVNFNKQNGEYIIPAQIASDGNSIEVTFTPNSRVTTGTYDIGVRTLLTPCTDRGYFADALTSISLDQHAAPPTPTVTGLEPASCQAGTQCGVRLSGTNLLENEIYLHFGSDVVNYDVRVANNIMASPNFSYAEFPVNAKATVGSRQVRAFIYTGTTPPYAESKVGQLSFTVTAGKKAKKTTGTDIDGPKVQRCPSGPAAAALRRRGVCR